MIDLHCHIDLYPNPAEIIRICNEKKIYVLSVTTTPSAWEKTNKLSMGYQRIKTALGLHPQLAAEREFELPLFLEHINKTRYVGEIGLDGSIEHQKTWQTQTEVFEYILSVCQSVGGKIMTIHSRAASKPVISYLAKYPNAGIPILHWFSGSLNELTVATEIGCWFSVNPVMARSKSGRILIASMPKEKVLLETDGPFTNIANKNLYPWDSILAIQDLATIWNIPSGEVEKIIINNFKRLLIS